MSFPSFRDLDPLSPDVALVVLQCFQNIYIFEFYLALIVLLMGEFSFKLENFPSWL